MQARLVPLCVAVVFAVSCGSGGAGSGDVPDVPSDTSFDPVSDLPGLDTIETAGSLSAREADLRVVVSGSDLIATLPVRTSSADRVEGLLRITVTSLTDATFSEQGETWFFTSGATQTVTVQLPSFADAADPTKQAAYLVGWRLESGGAAASGVRSLFAVTPKTQVVLLGPQSYSDGEATRIKVFARDPTTGQPFASQVVTVRATLGGQEQDLPLTTDQFGAADGTLTLSGQGQATIDAFVAGQDAQQACHQVVDVVRERRVLVTTDKPMYQPGQTMHLRALALKTPSLVPVSGEDCLLEVLDGRGNKVFKQHVTTGDYGVVSADFVLATLVNEGTYKVRATIDDTVTDKSVTVQTYALPKFNLTVTPDKSFYLVGGGVKGTVSAQYFFGEPVAGGAVKLVFSAADTDMTQFATLLGTTGSDGIYAFSQQLPSYMVGQSLTQGLGMAQVHAEVTDTAGQLVTKDVALTVSQDPFDVVVIPESGELVPGVENRIYVFARDPTGAPVQAAITVQADGGSWNVASDSTGVASFAVKPSGTTLAVSVTARDAAGNQAQATTTFTAAAGVEAVLVRPDRAMYKVGDTANVTAFAPAASDRVYLDVLRHGQVVIEDAGDVKDGQAIFAIDLDDQMSGDVVFAAYYLGESGRVVRDERLCYVVAADSLSVDVTPDKSTYKPGDSATVAFQVRGHDGSGVQAALGLMAVDEAVYALTDAQPGLLKAYFQLEAAIRQPQYEISGVDTDLSTLVDEDPTDPAGQQAQEETAEAAFAALGNPSETASASSWDQALAATQAILGPVYQKDLTAVISAAQARSMQGGYSDYNDVFTWVLAEQVADPFGNAYVMTEASTDAITMTSWGPDEVPGTSDDWSGTIQSWDLYGWEAEDGAGGGPKAASDSGNAPADAGGGDQSATGVRVRQDFPETLYVNPLLITAADGSATAQIPIADSITTWRLSVMANSLSGRLGSTTAGIKVFMDFFTDIDAPRTLTRGDQVQFPVAVYNYLPTAQTVNLTIDAGDWADLTTSPQATLSLGPGEVGGTSIGLTAKTVGWHGVTVTAIGSGGAQDAVMRQIQVVPDGQEVRGSASGLLAGTITQPITFPVDAIPGTPTVLVKIYPGVMAQAVEGLDSLLQMPSGCFEQTTSTLWPDALVLNYLKTRAQAMPDVELKARGYITAGYQRLLTFECTGGGFTWFGDPNPANAILTSLGVLEFGDIAQVMDIDETLIPRTARWLSGKQATDGSWHEDRGSEFATVQYDDLMTTCLATWALGTAGTDGSAAAARGVGYVKAHLGTAPTTYALALCANALAVAAPTDPATTKALSDLAARATTDGDVVHWDAGVQQPQYDYGGGGDGTSIEATALAVLALMQGASSPDLVSSALGWLASHKDTFGNWGSTHATILSLRAFVTSLSAVTSKAAGTVTMGLNGQAAPPLVIDSSNQDMFFQVDLSSSVAASGDNTVTVSFAGTGSMMYQVVWSHYEPGSAPSTPGGPLAIDVSYDKTELAVNDVVTVTTTVTNVSDATAKMVLIDLGVPPGFDVLTDDLQAAVAAQTISKFEMTDRQIIVYVDAIDPGKALVLTYQLKAKWPLKAQAPDSQASLYYDQTQKAVAPGKAVTVQ